MRHHLICFFATSLLLCGCTSGKLSVNSVAYQSLRTDFAQPQNDKKVSKAFYRIYELKPDALAENMYLFIMPNNITTKTINDMDDLHFINTGNVYDTYIHGSLIDFQ